MKKLLCCAISLFAMYVSVAQAAPSAKDVIVTNDESSPVPVNPQTIVEWRYVGLTTDEDDGRFEFGGLVGVAAMNKACAGDYGAGARAASMAEAYFRDDGLIDSRTGWLAPGQALIVLLDTTPTTLFFALDASTGARVGVGVTTAADAASVAYCDRYTLSGAGRRGPVTSPLGFLFTDSCTIAHPAACSAPVAIPVAP